MRRGKKKEKRTLVLNNDMTPFAVISWKRAFVLSMINAEMPGEGAEIIEYYDDIVKSAGGKEFFVPSIARLASYVKRKGKVPFSRKNVFIRDDLRCQYCNKKFSLTDLTFDHVISRAEWKKKKFQGTPTRWTNIVTACRKCNHYKGDSSLEKSGLRLVKTPVMPDTSKYVQGFVPWQKNVPEEWKPYLKVIYKDL